MARKPAQPDPPQPAPGSAFAALAALRGALPAGPEPEPEPASAGKAAPFGQRIVVRRERKGRGGKTVTVVHGITLAGPALEEFARTLRQALGTGGGVEGEAIVLHGEQSGRVREWLTGRGATRVVIAN